MTDTTPEHLTITETSRGLAHLPPIAGTHGGTVHVYESSNAEGPHLWLKVSAATVQLPAASAVMLAEQLVLLVQNHYQGPISVGQLLQVDISIDEAAVILGASAERVVALLNGGDIEFSRVGPALRPYLASVLDFKRADDLGITG